MPGDLTGRVALVTGASKGIGAGIAKELAAAGATLAVNFNSDRAGAERVVDQIENAGGSAFAIQANIGNQSDVKCMISQIVERTRKIDIVVNNASVFEFMPIDDVTELSFRNQYDINVLGTILVTQESLKHFPSSGGSIINVSSLASNGANVGSTIYAGTKAAVNAMTSVFAIELAARGIRVNGIMPGNTNTEGATRIGVIGSTWEEKLVADTPLGRTGQPSDFGPVAVFLASDASGWITGQTIAVSGGLR